ncbi:CinA family protein [Quadrisphaera sp. DSM 44207]|uniref:CinA family protein n=1 Tax=Quadrisphaera sp. DSM 44207 TaxID=1881057 RepID=UPI000B0F7F81|nr:nicotinamide-nucleotide amidohydrolase family protein [Quadrisphaera sp. DSM 44207]
MAALRAAGLTVAVAESLTAGLVSARLADVPGASAVLRGGVVAYATDVKAGVLGVDAALLAEHGPVHEQVALAMARGARDLLGADLGVATTGVAGPRPQGGQPVGTVHVAVAGAGAGGRPVLRAERLALPGDRAAVRAAAAAAALRLLAAATAPA